MNEEHTLIEAIPALVWGKQSRSVYIYAHGRHGNKEEAAYFARIAERLGYQTLSFDLPKHGERSNEDHECSIQNGVHDFNVVSQYVAQRWNTISFFACSLGAYFGLLAFENVPFRKCLFHSPVLDMERIIRNMMRAINVNEQLLERNQTIDTPFGETLSWTYFDYVRRNPVLKWGHDTHLLCGSQDELIEKETVDLFCKRFACQLTVVDGAGHYFRDSGHLSMRDKWLEDNI